VDSPASDLPLLEILRLGIQPHQKTWELQQELLEKRAGGEINDTLILVEHEAVITVGRGGDLEAAQSAGLPVVEVERGGEATYHGPGQVVAYPILALPEGKRDLHIHLRNLEEVIICVLAELDIVGQRKGGLTGVWIGEQKVASVGVAVRHWVTWYGFALNVHTDLTQFGGFRPCGLDPKVMTRVADHADLAPATILLEVLIVKHMQEVFGYRLPDPPPLDPGPEPTGGCSGGPSRFPDLPIIP
jgi:lipoate-protein ligase B